MVGISADLLRNLPSLIPRHVVFIDQHAHQLSHCNAGVRIIQLERHFIRQQAEIAVFLFETRDYTLNRCGNEEILLAQTQFLALIMFIGRI